MRGRARGPSQEAWQPVLAEAAPPRAGDKAREQAATLPTEKVRWGGGWGTGASLTGGV